MTDFEIDKKSLGNICGGRTFVKMNQCMICGQIGSQVSAQFYVLSPSNLPHAMVIHCNTIICEKSAKFVVRNNLAKKDRFLITNSFLHKFKDELFRIPRSDGTIINAKFITSIGSLPVVFSKSRKSIGFWFEWYDSIDQLSNKVVTIDELFEYNPLMLEHLSEITLELIDEDEFKVEFPELYNKISTKIAQLNTLYFSIF